MSMYMQESPRLLEADTQIDDQMPAYGRRRTGMHPILLPGALGLTFGMILLTSGIALLALEGYVNPSGPHCVYTGGGMLLFGFVYLLIICRLKRAELSRWITLRNGMINPNMNISVQVVRDHHMHQPINIIPDHNGQLQFATAMNRNGQIIYMSAEAFGQPPPANGPAVFQTSQPAGSASQEQYAAASSDNDNDQTMPTQSKQQLYQGQSDDQEQSFRVSVNQATQPASNELPGRFYDLPAPPSYDSIFPPSQNVQNPSS